MSLSFWASCQVKVDKLCYGGKNMKQTMEPIRDPEKIAEVKDLLFKHFGYRDYFLFTLGINTGLRISDLLELKVKDVRGKTHLKLIESKRHKDRKIKFGYELIEMIEEYTRGKADDDYLFQSRNGKNKKITRQRAYDILKEVSVMANLEDCATHTLRKTFGYHVYKRTKDVVMLQKIFNHSEPEVTLRYIGIDQDMQDKALEGFFL